MSVPVLVGVILAALGLPLFLVLSAVALAGFTDQNLNLGLYVAELLRLADNPTLLAVPLFGAAGYLLAESRAPQRLVRLARALVGWAPGGVSLVVLAVMAVFTAFTGASGITIIALGGLLLPALVDTGYSERFSLGLVTASGSVGLLFPPSLPLILYGVIAEVPINHLFIAGIVPGLVLVSGMSALGVQKGWKLPRRWDRPEPILPALKDALWEALLPVVVLGGIYGGKFTTTEAAVVVLVYLFIVECFIKKDIHIARDLPRVLKESSVLVGAVLLILGSALALTNYLVYSEVPSLLLEWMKGVVSSRVGFLLLLNLFLLAVGCLMDIFSALVVVVPLILPAAKVYGVDPVHLGVVFLANLEIGYCTPPVGMNLFISSFRFRKPVLQLYVATLPFLMVELVVLALITYVPELTLFPLELIGR